MKYIIEDTTLKNIADAIREKNGETTEYLPSEMPGKIEAIETGGSGGGTASVNNDFIYSRKSEKLDVFSNITAEIEKGTMIDATELLSSASMISSTNPSDHALYALLSGKNVIFYSLNNAFKNNAFFSNSSNLVDVSAWDVSNVKDFSSVFEGCTNMTEIDLSRWDTKNAMNFEYMFSGCSKITEVAISNWNTENLFSTKYMFNSSIRITELDLSNWNTENLIDCSYMFNNASGLITLNLSGWKTGKVTSFARMFYACSAIVDFSFLEDWDTQEVTSLNCMFYNCKKIEKLDLGKWNLAKCDDYTNAFSGCAAMTKLILPNMPKFEGDKIFSNGELYDLTFANGGNFDSKNYVSALTFNLTNLWKGTQDTAVGEGTYGSYYEAFANSIGPVTSGKVRNIKLYTNLYNSLSDEQKALLTDKGYTITYGTS